MVEMDAPFNVTLPVMVPTQPTIGDTTLESPPAYHADFVPPISPEHTPINSPELKPEEPLYTEIRIPLPPLPQPKATPNTTSPKSRSRAHTLHTLSPFRRRSSSGTKDEAEEWPRIKKQVRSKEIASAMSLSGRHKRSGTIDALAVVPAVLVLSAELFTPTENDKRKGMSTWENGII